jgi:hypothetical protein
MPRKKMTPEERAADEARRAETTRMLEERIAYHTAKAKEEEEARAKRSA